MTQADQPQRELVAIPSSHLVTQQKSRLSTEQGNDKSAVLAFMEYVQSFTEVFHNERDLLLPFDTGEYYINRTGFSSALYWLGDLINETLKKKTLARIGRKSWRLGSFEYAMLHLSSYLGIYNIALSLSQMLNNRAGGLLESLRDEELQTLSNYAVVEMLKRKQRVPDKHDGFYIDEEATNFGYGIPSSDISDAIANKRIITYFTTPKKYPFASDQAKHAAEAIVAAEVVRLRLFLEALQGTLRFLDRLTRLPTYTERQVPIQRDDKERDQKLIDGIISLLHAFLDENTDTTLQQKKEANVVESELSQVVQNIEVVMNTEQNFPDDIVAWLLEDKKQPAHPSISSFVDIYLKRLVVVGKEKITLREDGAAVLPRWKSPEGGSYGYNPADIAYHLNKLNTLLYEVTHGKQMEDIHLDGEALLSFSTLFGFYNLCSYFLYCQHEYPPHIADEIIKSPYPVSEKVQGVASSKWLNRAYEVLKPFPEIDSWNAKYAFGQWIERRIYGYSDNQLVHTPPSPDMQYWFELKGRGAGYEYIHIIWEEYNRFVTFLKSLRMLCATLAGYNKALLDGKEKQAESEQVTEATEFMHVEIAGAVITLSRKEAALVVYADAKYKRKKVKVTSAQGLEVVAYLARHVDDDFYAAIFPRLPLQERITETAVVQCDNLKVGDDNTLTLFAGNVTEVFLEE